MLVTLAALVALWEGTLTPWVVENGAVLALSYAKCWASSALAPCGFVVATTLPNMLIVEGVVAVQAILNATLYASTPTFHAVAPQHTLSDMVRNVGRSTIPVHTLTTCVLLALCHCMGACDTFPNVADDLRRLQFTQLALKFLAFRIISDVVFYTTHRWQHVNPRVYSRLHARHHKHRVTSLRTNFQFTIVDLFLEGSLPSIVATLVLALCARVPFTPLEHTLCLGYVQWYQIGSHSAKDVPSITAVPPIAPLYNCTLARRMRPVALREHQHVRFHAAHHRVVRGNYGISPWLDHILGTAVAVKKITPE